MDDCGAENSHGMHVVHDGPRQGPPLLLIHGSGASGASWGAVVGALADHHHVIRVDLPGCGQSPPAPSYDVPDQAGRVALLLDDLGLRHVTLVGHSSGGYVATALAEQRPNLVGSLALISTGPSLDALLPQPFILRALLAPPLGPLLWPRRSDAMIRKGISSTTAHPVDIPDDAVADLKNITYRAFLLSRRLGARPSVDPEVAYTWRRTVTSRGQVRVDGLADEVGWGRKRLWSRFRSQIGLPPKSAAQLVRFDHAAHLLAAGHAVASVAAQSGYVDQSHLHREVKAIAGVTPTAVATEPWLAIDDVAWPAAPRT